MYLHQSTHMQPTHKPKLKQQQISTKSNTMTQHTHMCTRAQPHQHQHFTMLQTFELLHFFIYVTVWRHTQYLQTNWNIPQFTIRISSTELELHVLVTYNNHIYMHNKLSSQTTQTALNPMIHTIDLESYVTKIRTSTQQLNLTPEHRYLIHHSSSDNLETSFFGHGQ